MARDLVNIGMVTDAIWSEYNNDGNKDMVLVGEWMPVTFLKWTGSKFEKDDDIHISLSGQATQSNGWWSSIEEIQSELGDQRK